MNPVAPRFQGTAEIGDNLIKAALCQKYMNASRGQQRSYFAGKAEAYMDAVVSDGDLAKYLRESTQHNQTVGTGIFPAPNQGELLRRNLSLQDVFDPENRINQGISQQSLLQSAIDFTDFLQRVLQNRIQQDAYSLREARQLVPLANELSHLNNPFLASILPSPNR